MKQLQLDRALFTDLKVLIFSHSLANGSKLVFGVNAYKIREVVVNDGLSPLSCDYLPFVGMHDYRGIPVPVIDFSQVVPDSSSQVKLNRIVIIESMGRLTGLLTDSGLKVIEFQNEDYRAPTFSTPGDAPKYVAGLFKHPHAEGFIQLIDIESIIEPFIGKKDQEMRVDRIGKDKKVLIVEDSVLFQKKASRLFNEMGFQVVIESDGDQGFKRASVEKFDLIFTDIEMPVMNGIEMVRKLKSESALSVPILFHSSLSTPSMIDLIKEEKLGGYLTKFEGPLIVEAIKKIFT